MELRIIDGQPIIITRAGKKETATPASDVVAQARQRIKNAEDMLVSLQRSTAEAQVALQAALLQGSPTAPYRAEISNVDELEIDQRHEISDATADISHVHLLLDQQAADRIRQSDAAAIAALVKPFADFIQENQHECN